MKKYIKRRDPTSEYEWTCSKCGLDFTLYGPLMSYFRPNYCPACGTQYASGEPSPFTKFDKQEDEYFE